MKKGRKSMKNLYKVNFSVDNIPLKKQQDIFESVLKLLNYNERMGFHVEVIDTYGGRHNIWDNTGIDPNGHECKKCGLVNCGDCVFFKERTDKNGK